MRKATRLPVAFVVAALFVAALAGPAGAAPPSSEDTETGVTCDGLLGHITVQTTPGGQISAWNTETGEHYVVKSSSWTLSVDATIDGVEHAFTYDPDPAFKDTGARGKANGRTELVECVADRSGTFDLSELSPPPDGLDADVAKELNSYLGTDVFAEGSEISGPYSEEFVYMVLVPGKK